MQTSAPLDDSTTRSGRKFRQVSDLDISTTTSHYVDPTASITTQRSSGIFQTYSHRSSPDTSPEQETLDGFLPPSDSLPVSQLSNSLVNVTGTKDTEEKRCILQHHQDSHSLDDEQDNQSAQVSVIFSPDSRVISCPKPYSPSYINRPQDDDYIEQSPIHSSGPSPGKHKSSLTWNVSHINEDDDPEIIISAKYAQTTLAVLRKTVSQTAPYLPTLSARFSQFSSHEADAPTEDAVITEEEDEEEDEEADEEEDKEEDEEEDKDEEDNVDDDNNHAD